MILPTRDLDKESVRNVLKSLSLQTHTPEIIIADYGSTLPHLNALASLAYEFGAIIYHAPPGPIWSLAVARNIGLRRANGKYAMTLDADCIIEPQVVATVLLHHLKHPNSFIASRVCHLPEMNLENIELPRDYPKLSDLSICDKLGYGTLMSAPKEWWLYSHGFDERLKVWGGEDDDMMDRAKRGDMKIIKLETLEIQQTKIFHQAHTLTKNARVNVSDDQFIKHIRAKNLIRIEQTIIRNNENWGEFPTNENPIP